MPGDDLLFHRLSDSTIGAIGFHGRVRDGIGWGTDAIATKQWSRCAAETCVMVQIDVVHLIEECSFILASSFIIHTSMV